LVVQNPYAAQAVVDVTLTTPDDQTHPGRLQGVVLGPLDARAFELNNYALQEKALAAEIVAPQGRVAAASVVVSPGGVRSSLAVAEPATQWILPGAGAETEVVVRALADQDAPVGAEIEGEQGAIPALDLEVVPAGTTQSFGLLQSDGGFVVRSDGLPEMLAGRRMFLEERTPVSPPADETDGGGGKAQGGGGSGQKRAGDKPADQKKGGRKTGDKRGGQKDEEPPPATADIAATSGSSLTSDRWLVLPAVGPAGGPSVVLLQNPGDEEVTASVTLLGAEGSLGASESVTVPARSTVRFPIPEGAPAAALVEGGELVAAQATLTPAAFAVTLGLAI
jgi:hypothetical protein